MFARAAFLRFALAGGAGLLFSSALGAPALAAAAQALSLSRS